jgi:small subunit ribosomal protein S20
MPNIKSAMKAMRQNVRRRAVNLKALDAIKKSAKQVRKFASAANKSEAQKALSQAFAALDKAAKKNIIHRNNASRKKARLSALVAKLK